MLIHVTFADGTTALFLPWERVIVRTWMSDDGEYFDNPDEGPACDILKPNLYVLARCSRFNVPFKYLGDDDLTALSSSKIVRAKNVEEHPSFCAPLNRN